MLDSISELKHQERSFTDMPRISKGVETSTSLLFNSVPIEKGKALPETMESLEEMILSVLMQRNPLLIAVEIDLNVRELKNCEERERASNSENHK